MGSEGGCCKIKFFKFFFFFGYRSIDELEGERVQLMIKCCIYNGR